MTEAVVNPESASQPDGGPRWLRFLVVGLAGLFYAYAVWNAVAHLVTMAVDGLSVTGWVTLLFGVIFPAIVFALSFAIGRRRNTGEQALVLLAGLGVVAVFWLSLIGYSVLSAATLVATVG